MKSCSLDDKAIRAKTAFTDLDSKEQKDMLFQLQHGISPERHQQMKNYAQTLRKKFPKMSIGRVQEKTARYFRIKLVKAKPTEDDDHANS